MNRVTDGPWKETIIGLSAGMTAGFAQTVICAPMELVKLRVQHQAIGKAKHYQGNWATLMEAYCSGGVRGCYRRFWITALRDIPGFGMYFATHETLMHFTVKKQSISKNDMRYYVFFFLLGWVCWNGIMDSQLPGGSCKNKNTTGWGIWNRTPVPHIMGLFHDNMEGRGSEISLSRTVTMSVASICQQCSSVCSMHMKARCGCCFRTRSNKLLHF